jgi:hypothetical protein
MTHFSERIPVVKRRISVPCCFVIGVTFRDTPLLSMKCHRHAVSSCLLTNPSLLLHAVYQHVAHGRALWNWTHASLQHGTCVQWWSLLCTCLVLTAFCAVKLGGAAWIFIYLRRLRKAEWRTELRLWLQYPYFNKTDYKCVFCKLLIGILAQSWSPIANLWHWAKNDFIRSIWTHPQEVLEECVGLVGCEQLEGADGSVFRCWPDKYFFNFMWPCVLESYK